MAMFPYLRFEVADRAEDVVQVFRCQEPQQPKLFGIFAIRNTTTSFFIELQ
jgi:hypothetical protein